MAYKPLPIISVLTVTADYTLIATDQLVLVDSASPHTITLPTIDGGAGRVCVVKQIGVGAVTLAAQDGAKIDGGDTIVYAAQYNSMFVVTDGADWWILGLEAVA